MAQLLVRDVPDDIASALKKRAAKNGRSAEAEHRAILEETLKSESSGFWEEARKFLQEQEAKGQEFDSTPIIRKSRDEGW